MKPESLWTVWKLRLQLWWMFGVEEWKNGKSKNHRLKIRRRFKSSAHDYGFAGYWAWVCVVQSGPIDINATAKIHRKKIVQEFSLGLLRQWTLEQAISLAARKAEWVLHPDQEPLKEPEPNPPQPKHAKVYRLLDKGLIAVECLCGWGSAFPKCHPERDSANRCNNCRMAEEAYDVHQAEERYKDENQTETTAKS